VAKTPLLLVAAVTLYTANGAKLNGRVGRILGVCVGASVRGHILHRHVMTREDEKRTLSERVAVTIAS